MATEDEYDQLPLSRHQLNKPRARWFQQQYRPPLALRTLSRVLKYLIPSILISLLYGLYLYEPHIELAFYSRKWVTEEIEAIGPLAGCFDAPHVSPLYSVSNAVYGPKRTEVQAGMTMRFGLDCYDYAGTVKETPHAARLPLGTPGTPWEERIPFHTYWRADLRTFGPRQEYMIKSFFATQDLDRTKLVLWSNGDLTGNEILKLYLKRYPVQFEMRIVDIPSLARQTALEGSGLLKANDPKAWVDGDLVRLLLLWNYGGVWVDMDSLLTRDLEPLFEHEFVTQWDCYDKKYTALNGALMRFRKHSPYLCEAFHLMTKSRPPRSGSTDWGSILYLRLWRRLVAGGIPPFKILPFCFNDGRSCRDRKSVV